MSAYPCTNPNSGVRTHRSEKAWMWCCGKVFDLQQALSSAPPPSLASEDTDEIERRVFLESGGKIESGKVRNGERYENWSINGMRHRENGPAIQYWHNNGVINNEYWYRNDVLHREDGPAWMVTDRDGAPVEEEWYLDGEVHRVDGPAVQIWEMNRLVVSEWKINGKFHRLDGPAISYWNEIDGTLSSEEWYLNGTEYDDEESYWKATLPLFREENPEFDDMPDDWLLEYLKGQRS